MLKFYLKKLKNNLTVFIIKTQKLSSLDITLYIKTGSVYEDKKNNGISHLLEHLLFLKTKQLELHPIVLDIYPYTRKDFTYFEITTHKDLINDALSSLFSVIAFPDFTENNLKIIKKITTEEIMEFYNNPYNILNQKIDQFLYQKNSMALNVASSEENLKNITITNLKEWYKNFYTPSNMILTLAGDINISKTIKQINNIFHFNNLSDRTSKNKKIGKIVYPKTTSKPIKLKNSNNFKQTYLTFVFPVSSINNSKYIHFILLAEILNKKIRQKMENSGLFYDIQVYYHHYLNVGEFRIITACKKNNTDKIIKKIHNFINTIKISNSFFNETKKYIKYQFLLKEDNVDELSSLSLYLFNNNPKLTTLKDEIDKIESIKFNEIITLKKKYFNKKKSYHFLMN